MKHFKKRTVALVLASVITVMGAFGADNYKNSLMSLKFDNKENGDTSITVLTKTNYDAEISPLRKDANTFIIVLPETNSEMQEPPAVSGSIQSVDVVTMPYTPNNKGYTKITIKTLSTGLLTAQKAVFLPTPNNNSSSNLSENIKQPADNINIYDSNSAKKELSNNVYLKNENNIEDSMRQFQNNNTNTQTTSYQNTNNGIQSTENKNQTTNDTGNTTEKKSNIDPMERNLLILGSLAVLLTSIFLFMRGRNKLKEVIGEDFEYSLEDDSKQKKPSNKQNIKNTIQNLDKTYNTPKISTINRPSASQNMPINQINNTQSIEKDTVLEDITVDLDQLYIDANKNQNETVEENQDIDFLADFLNDYESQEKEKQHELELIEKKEQETNELYEKFMNGEDILFSKDDIQKINDLLMAEISDETIENIKRKEVSNPIRPAHATEEEILENFITTLTIKQNISFSRDDVEALRKLINVEIDNDFVADLRTNPERVKSMQKEIEDRSIKPHRVTELLTLNIEDRLPKLSEEINRENNLIHTEPEEIKFAEENLKTDKHTNIDSLPDLQDVMANPEKYKEPEPEKYVANEEVLLKNIENVSFKPFYDEKQELEIINTPEDTKPQTSLEENLNLSMILEEENHTTTTTPVTQNIKEEEDVQTYTFNNKEYTIIKTSVLKDGAECHLVKSVDGYSVLGYMGENIFNLKDYDNLSPETLQTRLSERLPEGGERYMIRCGKHKFILDIKDNKMEFVMDLC